MKTYFLMLSIWLISLSSITAQDITSVCDTIQRISGEKILVTNIVRSTEGLNFEKCDETNERTYFLSWQSIETFSPASIKDKHSLSQFDDQKSYKASVITLNSNRTLRGYLYTTKDSSILLSPSSFVPTSEHQLTQIPVHQIETMHFRSNRISTKAVAKGALLGFISTSLISLVIRTNDNSKQSQDEKSIIDISPFEQDLILAIRDGLGGAVGGAIIGGIIGNIKIKIPLNGRQDVYDLHKADLPTLLKE